MKLSDATLAQAFEHLRTELASLDAKLDKQEKRLDAKLDEQAKKLDAKLDEQAKKLDAKLDEQAKQLRDDVSRQLGGMSDKLELVERRVGAIERFPYPGISQPPRLYGTEAHSVSSPRRVRAGYSG